MNRKCFQNLSEKNNIEQTNYFSQKEFKKEHFQQVPDDLCAGIVQLWIQYTIERKNLLTCLNRPRPALLKKILSVQRNSYYPSLPEDRENVRLSELDKALLKKKYGSDDWNFLMEKIQKANVGDFLELDLTREFNYSNLAADKYAAFPEDICVPLNIKNGRKPFFSLLILRYLKGAKMTGHRMAYFKSSDGRHKFFDPNSGEITCPDSKRFENWLNDFFSHSNYKKRKPVPGQPLISFYNIEIG